MDPDEQEPQLMPTPDYARPTQEEAIAALEAQVVAFPDPLLATLEDPPLPDEARQVVERWVAAVTDEQWSATVAQHHDAIARLETKQDDVRSRLSTIRQLLVMHHAALELLGSEGDEAEDNALAREAEELASDDPPVPEVVTDLDVLADGTLMVLHPDNPRSRLLVITQRAGEGTPPRYGVHYVSDPTRGVADGGSGWSYTPDSMRPPTTPEELVWAQQFHAAKRVRDLKAQLADAEADVEAVARYANLVNTPRYR